LLPRLQYKRPNKPSHFPAAASFPYRHNPPQTAENLKQKTAPDPTSACNASGLVTPVLRAGAPRQKRFLSPAAPAALFRPKAKVPNCKNPRIANFFTPLPATTYAISPQKNPPDFAQKRRLL